LGALRGLTRGVLFLAFALSENDEVMRLRQLSHQRRHN
jgi:hypothetical protein